jgi:alpha-glucosidase (family GH31 glycosyl hydrolase)
MLVRPVRLPFAVFSYAVGLPLMRTLWMEFPGDKNVYDSQWETTQFIVGPSLLVAPILIEGNTFMVTKLIS